MKDQYKTKNELINEIVKLRKRVAGLEKAKPKRTEPGLDPWILEHAVASSINAIGITDMQGKLVYVNDACVSMWGYDSKEEVLGRLLPEFWAGERVQQTIRTLPEKGSRVGEDVGEKKDGTLFNVRFAASVIRDDSGNPKYMFGSFIDISKQKRSEEEMFLAKERLQYLLSSTSAVIYSSKFSGDYGATFITSNVTQMTGHEPDDFINKTNFWLDRIHPEDKQRILKEVNQVLEKDYYTYEYRFQKKDGQYIWVRDEMKMVRDGKGKPLEIIGYWIDISEKKEAERALQESYGILEKRVKERTTELTTSIKKMKEEIRERRKAEKELRKSEEKLRRSQAKLKKQALALEQKNIALREIIAQIEIEKRKIKEDVSSNVDTVFAPIIDGLKRENASPEYIKLLEHHLEGLASSFGSRVKEDRTNLTPREIEICSLIRGGLTSKDISRLINISSQTVERHRKNIRRKFGLSNRKINLTSFLREL